MTDRSAAVSLFLAVTLAVLMFAPRTAPRPEPIPVREQPAAWTPTGAPFLLHAGATPDSTALESGAPQSSEAPPEPEAGLETPHSATGGASAPETAPPAAVTGIASWFCKPPSSPCTRGFPASGQYAAAGPRIRAWLGAGWRGQFVYVTAGARSIRARLVDVCQCHAGTGTERAIDLYSSVFEFLGPLSRGLIKVTVAR